MIQIKEIKGNEETKLSEFTTRTWAEFNKEKGYIWQKEIHRIAAIENKEIIGFAQIEIMGGAAYLDQLLISKKARRKGIGKMLLDKFEEYAKKKKCHIAYLKTSEKHIEALKFYEKNNYKIFASLPNVEFNFKWHFLKKEVKS